jgi:hypothetical protein
MNIAGCIYAGIAEKNDLRVTREQKLLTRYGNLERAAIRNNTSGNLRPTQAKQELTHIY